MFYLGSDHDFQDKHLLRYDSGACLFTFQVCDAKVDCQAEGDGKDEQNCEEAYNLDFLL